jgi:hypothetical protein
MPVNRNCGFRRQIFGRERSREIVNYDGVTMEIQRIWDVRTNVIPVIIGASRTISE